VAGDEAFDEGKEAVRTPLLRLSPWNNGLGKAELHYE
jgi:hypothetical protein